MKELSCILGEKSYTSLVVRDMPGCSHQQYTRPSLPVDVFEQADSPLDHATEVPRPYKSRLGRTCDRLAEMVLCCLGLAAHGTWRAHAGHVSPCGRSAQAVEEMTDIHASLM